MICKGRDLSWVIGPHYYTGQEIPLCIIWRPRKSSGVMQFDIKHLRRWEADDVNPSLALKEACNWGKLFFPLPFFSMQVLDGLDDAHPPWWWWFILLSPLIKMPVSPSIPCRNTQKWCLIWILHGTVKMLWVMSKCTPKPPVLTGGAFGRWRDDEGVIGFNELVHWWVRAKYDVGSWGLVGGSRSLEAWLERVCIPVSSLDHFLCFLSVMPWTTLLCLATWPRSQKAMNWNLYKCEPTESFLLGVVGNGYYVSSKKVTKIQGDI